MVLDLADATAAGRRGRLVVVAATALAGTTALVHVHIVDTLAVGTELALVHVEIALAFVGN